MDIPYQANFTYERLLPRFKERYKDYASNHPDEWRYFMSRLDEKFPILFQNLFPLYGEIYDSIYFIEELLYVMADSWIDRSDELKTLDKNRIVNPLWFQSEKMVGAVCYVDLFANSLKNMVRKIPYLKDLGITYLHLMPLFRTPKGENDGGYAISSYREISPNIGTMSDLIIFAEKLRENGISLVLDFIFNHTSDEHEWALQAKEGKSFYQNYYWMFPNRKMPDAYEKDLREIFPDEHPGAFTYFSSIDKWVWTTFHSYQWDLNYQNPAVFVNMAKEMLFLANIGVEVLRLDAVAFVWKKLGTNCENLPEAQLLIQAFNTVANIVAPAMVFKSEAIVHPNDVIKYISPDICKISYNPLLMALLWESLATREVRLMRYSMMKRLSIPDQSSWVNYVRGHDDIGWTFSNEDADDLGINGYDHRRFLNEFYRGRFPGSFARGLPFQENPKTGDCRISGTCASLAGLEKAITIETDIEVNLAIKRIILIHGIVITIGGIPLIYLGDEIGALNDYGYLENKEKATDSRWVHRIKYDSEKAKRRLIKNTIEGKIYQNLKKLIQIRKSNQVFADLNTVIMDSMNPHVFAFYRKNQTDTVIVLANFSEKPQNIDLASIIGGNENSIEDLVSKNKFTFGEIKLLPYDFKIFRLLS